VFDEVQAAKPGAPIIHDVLKPATTFPDLKHLQGRSGTNVALSAHVRRGDLAQAFKESDYVFEQTFRNGKVIHAPLDPYSTVVEMDGPEGWTIHPASQPTAFVRSEI